MATEEERLQKRIKNHLAKYRSKDDVIREKQEEIERLRRLLDRLLDASITVVRTGGMLPDQLNTLRLVYVETREALSQK